MNLSAGAGWPKRLPIWMTVRCSSTGLPIKNTLSSSSFSPGTWPFPLSSGIWATAPGARLRCYGTSRRTPGRSTEKNRWPVPSNRPAVYSFLVALSQQIFRLLSQTAFDTICKRENPQATPPMMDGFLFHILMSLWWPRHQDEHLPGV